MVLWDHGLYGNYRFGYKSAFDIKVIDRVDDEKQQDRLIAVGERVQRHQMNWRWGDQGQIANNNTMLWPDSLFRWIYVQSLNLTVCRITLLLFD